MTPAELLSDIEDRQHAVLRQLDALIERLERVLAEFSEPAAAVDFIAPVTIPVPVELRAAA